MEKNSIVYLVAGLSSRFEGKIKQLCKIGPNNETLIEYSVNQAIKAGFKEIIFVVGEKTEIPFKELFKEKYNEIPVKYSKQTFDSDKRDRPWGTIDALLSAKEIIKNKFVICNGDDIYGFKTLKNMNEHLTKHNECATVGYNLLKVLPKEGKVNRGIFEVEEGYVKDIKEILEISRENYKEKGLTESTLCSMNLFALTPDILEDLKLSLEKFKKENIENRTIECLLPTELKKMLVKYPMKIYPSEEEWIGITNPEDEILTRKKIKEIEKK